MDNKTQEGLKHLEAARVALDTVDSNLRAARDLIGDNADLLTLCDELTSALADQVSDIVADLPEDGDEDLFPSYDLSMSRQHGTLRGYI